MRFLLLTLTLSILFANLATGQTMQTVIENLVRHKLIENEYKKDVELILTRQEDTSKTAILSALMYVEMIKMVGRERIGGDVDSMAQYLDMALMESIDQKNSTNLFEYLSKINFSGLITDSQYAEFKTNIEKNNYPTKLMLILDLLQKTTYSDIVNPAILGQKEKKYLTSMEIDDAITGWQKAGILNHLTKEQIAETKKKALASNNENLNDVLINFPDVVHWFDTELENLKDPYAELLQKFLSISHGVFKPTNISDNFSNPGKNKVTVKFSLNNKNYSKDFKVQDDWIDADFFDFVKQTVTENKLAGQFYELYEGGQGGIIIFLTTKQHQYLKTNKLVVFAEDYKADDE
jgi:hypothetical protein